MGQDRRGVRPPPGDVRERGDGRHRDHDGVRDRHRGARRAVAGARRGTIGPGRRDALRRVGSVMMEPLLKVRGLTKIYRLDGHETAALREVDLDIQPGEFTAIAGPSGSGKSTLLHLMGGLDHPTSGEVWLEGQRIDQLDHNALADLRLRKLGFVFQSYNLIPVFTALENAAFVLELQGLPRRQREDRARRALTDLGIGALADR